MNLTNNKLVKNITSDTKDNSKVFEQIAELLFKEGSITDKKTLVEGFKAREKQGSTALADGFAIPHTINAEIKSPKVVVLRKASISSWKTLDNSKVDTIIAIVVPKNGRDDHLTILSKLSAKLANPDFAKSIKESTQAIIVKSINEITNEESNTEKQVTKNSNKLDLVALTACPTGIAHTYMAAEYLEKTAKEMNLNIKIETQGQTVQNVLTKKEIDEAKAIIVAVDREVDLSRFSDKKIYKTTTKKVIADAKGHIENALKDKDTQIVASTIKSTGQASAIAGEGQMTLENFGKRSWKSVMNGVSFMLPFVIFGGILIAFAFLIDSIAGNSNAGSDFGHVNPVAGFFKDLGGVSMGLMVPVLTAYTMFALIGRPGLLPGFVIGMLAAGSGPSFMDVFGVGYPSWLPAEFSSGDAASAASGFIGGIVGAFLATVIVVYVSKGLDYLPQSLRGIKQILLLPLLGTLAATVIFWFVNIPLIYVVWGLLTVLYKMDGAGLTPLLALLLAGMMAVDMGGPINKTAYVFGTVMLSTATSGGLDAGYVYMAAVMAGGMVPPLAIAIATLFKRDKIWDQADKEGGITNWVMGASFITEGAIPFASKYPKSILLPNIIGSAITGLIVGFFGIGIQAPHGGIFVIALVKPVSGVGGMLLPAWLGAIIYISAILIGAFCSAMLIVYLRSKEVSKKVIS